MKQKFRILEHKFSTGRSTFTVQDFDEIKKLLIVGGKERNEHDGWFDTSIPLTTMNDARDFIKSEMESKEGPIKTIIHEIE